MKSRRVETAIPCLSTGMLYPLNLPVGILHWSISITVVSVEELVKIITIRKIGSSFRRFFPFSRKHHSALQHT